MKLVILLLALFIFLSCSTHHKEISDQKTLANKHKIHSEKIQRIMHELDNVMYKKNRSELERDDERYRYLLALSEKLQNMAPYMQKIIVMESLGEQKTLMMYSEALGKKGKEIRTMTENYHFERIQPLLDETLSLCKRCHTDFGVNPEVLSHYK
ncbi:MAG: hypothetical protein U9R50_08225 [Campylobacterota bacterium]|nr:hypothetical protein [Campylobacterota bacterium]